MIRLPNLPATFDALNEAKKDRQNDQENCDPEPLHAFPVVEPPLLDRPGTGIVKKLL